MFTIRNFAFPGVRVLSQLFLYTYLYTLLWRDMKRHPEVTNIVLYMLA